jgi:hypothetical protein
MTEITNSSVIKAIAVENDDLLIKFNTGSTYSYHSAAEHYSKLFNADSAGLYFNIYIKPKYQTHLIN